MSADGSPGGRAGPRAGPHRQPPGAARRRLPAGAGRRGRRHARLRQRRLPHGAVPTRAQVRLRIPSLCRLHPARMPGGCLHGFASSASFMALSYMTSASVASLPAAHALYREAWKISDQEKKRKDSGALAHGCTPTHDGPTNTTADCLAAFVKAQPRRRVLCLSL